MTAVAFDTLRFVRTLREKAKMSPEQAEGLADAVAEAIQNDLATKADIAMVRTDIEALRLSTKADLETLRLSTKTDIAMVRTDMEALRLSTKTDIEALRLSTKADLREAELRLEARVEGTKAEIIKWVVGSIGFQAIVIVGAVIALARGLH
ncbi:MAG: DUF1640 domain-containing protein [Actinomycetospora chiangmaiensis]|nr:DUF1640 domain-containing protein [Actinomycetospora chiangmaiensis]